MAVKKQYAARFIRPMSAVWMSLLALAISGCSGSKKVAKMDSPAPQVTTPQPKPLPVIDEPEVTPQPKAKDDPKPLVLANVYFDFDKYELRPEAREILAQHARLLKQHKDVHVLIEGHCDERGSVEYNLALGDKRARAVKAYLVSLGVESHRLSTISYGKERPLDFGHNEQAWAKNRRAQFVIKAVQSDKT